MRSTTSKGIVVFAAFCLVVLLLPLTVTAEVQTQITQIADFQPAESNNDEVVNIANTTIELNYETWDPLPSGIFVGGTVKESLIELGEYPVGIAGSGGGITHYSELYLAQPIKFAAEYVMTGTSQWVVRLPFETTEYPPSRIVFTVFKMDSATDYQILRRAALYGHPIGGDYKFDVVDSAGAELKEVCHGVTNWPAPPTSPGGWSYVRDGRVYAQFTAPLHEGAWYLLTAQAFYPADSRWQFYLCAGDLGSDNATGSRVAYQYQPAFDANVTRDQAVPADLGFSFVFQQGLGNNAASYTRMFNAGDELRFITLVPIGTTAYYHGCLNFMVEFRVNTSDKLKWGVDAIADTDAGPATTVLSHTYWTGVEHNSFILASNPMSLNYTSSTLIGGVYYVKFTFFLYIESAQRAEFLLIDDDVATLYDYQSPYQHLWRFSGLGADLEMNFFNLWSTVSLDNRSLNWSAGIDEPHHSGFWTGVGHWWDKHWTDVLAVTLIIVGVALAPFTCGGSYALVAIGIGMLLYQIPAIRDWLKGLIQYVLDGLDWLGQWLWKIGLAIWKALTWFVDQAIYYGSILIGLLVIAVAIALFVAPIYALVKIMGAFLMMAQGDYEKAAAQLSGLVAQGRSATSTLTGGRLG